VLSNVVALTDPVLQKVCPAIKINGTIARSVDSWFINNLAETGRQTNISERI
jgi:hypothetical protein